MQPLSLDMISKLHMQILYCALPEIRVSNSHGLRVLRRLEAVLLALRSRFRFSGLAFSSDCTGASLTGSPASTTSPWTVGVCRMSVSAASFSTDFGMIGLDTPLLELRAARSLARTRAASASFSEAASFAAILDMVRGLCCGCGSAG